MAFSTTSVILVTISFAIAFAVQLIRQFAEDSHSVSNSDARFFGWCFDLQFTFLFFGSDGFSVLPRIARVESMVEIVACHRRHYRSTRRILPLFSGRVGGLFWNLR